MKDASLDGEDLILILLFQHHFADEDDTLNMSEAQGFVALPYFLHGTAAAQFRSVKRLEGVTAWSEAVQYRFGP